MSKKTKVAPAERVSLSVATEDDLKHGLSFEFKNGSDIAGSVEPEASTPAEPLNALKDRLDIEPLRRLGDYQLIWQIGKDALSTTFAARRDGVDGILSMRVFERNADARRIQKAAKSAADLTHPNAVVVYDSGVTEDGAPYVVTDWIEGETLSEVLANSKRLQISRFLNVFMQICEALSEAHSRQLIHGNLCPSKVVFAHNQDELDLIKVIDFGMPPDPVQNAFYVSPDQWLDKAKVDARSDIYSLGCMMYEALVGTPPFVGHQKSSAALNYLHELASQYSPQSPEHNALKLLDCIIIKCIQSNRTKRFASVRELMDALNL
jgi:serine/threonine protein kinase